MKSLAILKRMIPALAAIHEVRDFSVSLSSVAEGYVDELKAAAAEDNLDLTRAINGLHNAGTATDFAEQRMALGKVIAIADRMLDQIPAGRYTRQKKADTVSSLRCRLQANLTRLSIAYRPSRADLEAVRRDSSLFTALVKGSLYDGQLSANDDIAAEQAFHLVDNGVDADFGGHAKMFEKASQLVAQIAA